MRPVATRGQTCVIPVEAHPNAPTFPLRWIQKIGSVPDPELRRNHLKLCRHAASWKTGFHNDWAFPWQTGHKPQSRFCGVRIYRKFRVKPIPITEAVRSPCIHCLSSHSSKRAITCILPRDHGRLTQGERSRRQLKTGIPATTKTAERPEMSHPIRTVMMP